MSGIGRFAPSSTGPAHPGTLLAALLCWLDARSRGDQVLLRIEDLDPERCRAEYAKNLCVDLAWLGLDWDGVVEQHTLTEQHAAALDQLEKCERLYPCSISRSELKAIGRQAPDGGWAYDNRHRLTPLPVGGWRACTEPLRVRLEDGVVSVTDESGESLTQDPALAFGDPVVRRRDGAVAYQLAVVVDDGAAGVTRVVRGRDIAASTATQVRLQQALGLPTPRYRHHVLLLENRERKLAKFHGAVSLAELRQHYSAPQLCGWLAWCAGLLTRPDPCMPNELLAHFTWQRVRRADVVVTWNGHELNRSDTSVPVEL